MSRLKTVMGLATFFTCALGEISLAMAQTSTSRAIDNMNAYLDGVDRARGVLLVQNEIDELDFGSLRASYEARRATTDSRKRDRMVDFFDDFARASQDEASTRYAVDLSVAELAGDERNHRRAVRRLRTKRPEFFEASTKSAIYQKLQSSAENSYMFSEIARIAAAAEVSEARTLIENSIDRKSNIDLSQLSHYGGVEIQNKLLALARFGDSEAASELVRWADGMERFSRWRMYDALAYTRHPICEEFLLNEMERTDLIRSGGSDFGGSDYALSAAGYFAVYNHDIPHAEVHEGGKQFTREQVDEIANWLRNKIERSNR